jgi:hypothetical protein
VLRNLDTGGFEELHPAAVVPVHWAPAEHGTPARDAGAQRSRLHPYWPDARDEYARRLRRR